MRVTHLVRLFVSALLVPLACTEPTNSTPQPLESAMVVGSLEKALVFRVAVSPAPVQLQVASTKTLTATAYDRVGHVITGRPTTWSSNASGIASVSSTGVVTGRSAGTAVVSATVNSKTGFSTVTVVKVAVASVTVSPTSFSLTAGGTQALSVVVKDASGNVLTGRVVTWTTSASSVATVSATGTVTGVAAGTATITATSDGVKGTSAATIQSGTTPPPSTRWVSGYYAGYQRSLYPETSVDFSLLTHILVGAIQATPTGGVTTDFYIDNVNGPIMAKTLSSRAHQAGRKAILMLGGSSYLSSLQSATSNTYRAAFVANLLATMDNLGYDGIDVDWEPMQTSDEPQALQFMKDLRAARPGMLLTFPVTWVSSNGGADPWYAQVAAVVDQLNMMSYGMADNWGGWVSWHQGALAGEGSNHPSSVSSSARAYTNVGVPAAKLGIGIAFYGSCWQGTNTMLQTLVASAGVVASDNAMSYTNIMSQYYNAAAYHWDATASSGYLGFSAPTGPQQCTLISYENAQSVAAKGAYVKSAGLGGAIVWTINQGHLPNAPAGQQDPLLSAAYNSIVP